MEGVGGLSQGGLLAGKGQSRTRVSTCIKKPEHPREEDLGSQDEADVSPTLGSVSRAHGGFERYWGKGSMRLQRECWEGLGVDCIISKVN